MKPFKKSNPSPWLLPLVLILTLILINPAQAVETEVIFKWVAVEVNAVQVPEMPTIQMVGRTELQEVFKRRSREAYLRWESELGKAQADEILNRFLKGVVGLFVPKTEIVYVYKEMTPCRRESVLAHELAHYLQHRLHGRIDKDQYMADFMHMVREMEAYQIEGRFARQFCGHPSEPGHL